MNSQTKICQNCQKEFTIDASDFAFYQKIKVPPPTFCPECRMIRRMCFRNERSLYKRKCNAPGHNEEVISIYHKDSPFKVYDQKYWWSDNWDPMEYGRDYDFSKPFFEQFRELMRIVPFPELMNTNNVNCNYCNWTVYSKDCYMSARLHHTENCSYAIGAPYTRDSVDILVARNSEACYEIIDCAYCYKLFFSQHCESCVESFLLYGCKNCSNCFGCINLRNKNYYIFNQSYGKDEYFKKIKELDISSHRNFLRLSQMFQEFKRGVPYKFANIIKSINVSGDNISNAKNCLYCFDSAKDIENLKYMFYAVDGAKDCYDGMFIGLNSELCYEVFACLAVRCFFTIFMLENSFESRYSILCSSSQNLFGCVGLRHKQYCILNKQYTKEEYEKLVPKIIEHMNKMPYIDKKGRVYKYGEFFPPELSPFVYNETIAQEYFPLTKEQAIEKGYCWKEPEQRDIKIDIKTEDLPDHIHPPKFCKAKLGRVKDVKDDIIGKVIECAHQGKCNEQCTTAFKIIPQELQFYRRMNLPLPRLCPNCRHYQRLKQRNPLKLWHRKCQCAGAKSSNGVYANTVKHFHGNNPCPNEFETTYAPERPEIVYCEECYLREVV